MRTEFLAAGRRNNGEQVYMKKVKGIEFKACNHTFVIHFKLDPERTKLESDEWRINKNFINVSHKETGLKMPFEWHAFGAIDHYYIKWAIDDIYRIGKDAIDGAIEAYKKGLKPPEIPDSYYQI